MLVSCKKKSLIGKYTAVSMHDGSRNITVVLFIIDCGTQINYKNTYNQSSTLSLRGTYMLSKKKHTTI